MSKSKTFIIALASFVLAVVLYHLFFHKPSPRNTSVAINKKPIINSESLNNNKALAVIAEYENLAQNDIELKKVQWLDLINSGEKKEFYCEYQADNKRYLSIYTLRDGNTRRLYHDTGFYAQIIHAAFDDKEYLIVYSIEGSGGFLGFDVLKWDGAGPLQVIFPEPEKKKDNIFFQGSIHVLDDRVYISGGTQKFELVLDNDKFKLQPYTYHPSYPELGNKCHIMRPVIKNDELTLLFDGEKIEFKHDSKSSEYISKKPIQIYMGDTLLLDDNLPESRSLRFFSMSPNLEWKIGFFSSLYPTKPGSATAAVNDSYGPWYKIEFSIATNRGKEY